MVQLHPGPLAPRYANEAERLGSGTAAQPVVAERLRVRLPPALLTVQLRGLDYILLR